MVSSGQQQLTNLGTSMQAELSGVSVPINLGLTSNENGNNKSRSTSENSIENLSGDESENGNIKKVIKLK